MEHGLVETIAVAGFTKRPLDLYYAFVDRPPTARIHPYLLDGTVAAEHRLPLPAHPDLTGVRVTFRSIR